MKIIQKTFDRMFRLICIMGLIIWGGSIYAAYTIGAVKAYELGRVKERMESPFKAWVESERPFCYDQGLVFQVRRGQKAFYPTY